MKIDYLKIIKGTLRKINVRLEKRATLLGAWASLLQIILLPTAIAGGYLIYLQINSYYQKADLHMEFSHPEALNFTLRNQSDVLAEGPFYGFILFDLDSGKLDPLPIPFKETSYIRGKAGQGANALMSQYGKAGHRYFGHARVFCKNCEKVRSYLIHVVHGQKENAWFIPLGDKELAPITPKAIQEIMNRPDEVLAVFCPESKRLSIK